MKTNSKHEVIARIAGPGLVLAALFVLVLSSSSAGRAQSRASSPAVPAAAPASAAQAAQPAAPSQRHPGGNHEGITVHGHWTIDIKNPDGTVASHHVFENSFDQIDGSDLLARLMVGAYVPGGFYIQLIAAAQPATGASFGMCDGQGNCFLYDTRFQPTGGPACFAGTLSGAQLPATPCGTLTPSITPNAPYSFTGNFVALGFTLTGSIQPPVAGIQMGAVISGMILCEPNPPYNNDPFSTAFSQTSPQMCGGGYNNLQYIAPNTITLQELTQADVEAQNISVATGQTIAVTVAITFGGA